MMTTVPFETFKLTAVYDHQRREASIIGQADAQSMDLVRAFRVPEDEQVEAAIKSDGVLTAIQKILDLSMLDEVWAKGLISLWHENGDPVINTTTGEQFTMEAKVPQGEISNG